MIKITLNGTIHNIEEGLNLTELLRGLDIDPDRVAVERNLEIVPKSTYQTVMLAADDRLEIVHFIGGGIKRQNKKRTGYDRTDR